MARIGRRVLSDLANLGERLRALRTKAGLSQTELAKAIGFNPTHGYKYILRLEKGLVPNPTLRTIASILDATHASWQDLTDTLPRISGAADSTIRRPVIIIDSSSPATAPAPPVTSQRGSIPLREWLRRQRHEKHHQLSRTRWQRSATAIEKVKQLLTTRPEASTRQREYLAFLRKTLATMTAVLNTRPQLLERELDTVLEEAAARRLNRQLLSDIQRICREAVSS